MEENGNSVRPNIRIEISNNIAEAMQVDQEVANDGEEGEIVDESVEDFNQDITLLPRPQTNETWNNIFPEKPDPAKLSERAKRFAANSTNCLTDQQLQELYESLGITSDDKNNRFTALHMHGTEGFTKHDLVAYFDGFKPSSVEWVDANSCNVVWLDANDAASALFAKSECIKGMPSENGLNTEEEGHSILLKNSHRDIEMVTDGTEKENEVVYISDITVKIPTGYWRLAKPCKGNTQILIRFGLLTDSKPLKTQSLCKVPDPVFGGLMSESRRKRMQGIFHRNPDIEEGKNPWGSLARDWYEDARYAEQDYKEPPAEPVKFLHRLGFKRSNEKKDDSEKEEETVEPEKKVTKMPRMRMYADEEEAKVKRKRQLQAMKVVKTEPTDDLRQMLNKPRKVVPNNVEERDLATKLRNRKLKETRIMIHQTHKRKTTPPRRRRRSSPDLEDTSAIDDLQTSSKVAVVIKKQKTPAVASTVWSRITERNRQESSSSAHSSTDASSDSASGSESDDEDRRKRRHFERPGFRSEVQQRFQPSGVNSALRIEINNDHFKK